MKKNIFAIGCLLFVATVFIFVACEKDVTVDLNTGESKIVIEGYIEAGLPPYIIITRSSPYFDPVDENTMQNMFVKNAVVKISTDGYEESLRIVNQAIDSVEMAIYIGQRPGVSGKSYHLEVEVDGKIYSSDTRIPQAVQLDSVWFKEQSNDSLGLAWYKFHDPDTLGNYYRIYTLHVGHDPIFRHPIPSVNNDNVINGRDIEFATTKGRKGVVNNKRKENLFKIGDTILLRFASMNADAFYFWRAVEQQISNNGNPFAAPASVPSNIKGGLGLWAGYGVFYSDTIFAKREQTKK